MMLRVSLAVSCWLLGAGAALYNTASAAEIPDEAALCALIVNTFHPREVGAPPNEKWSLDDKTAAELEAFAEAAQALGPGAGIANCDGFTVAYDIHADGDETGATAT